MNVKDLLFDYHTNPENVKVKAFFEKDNVWSILNVMRKENSHSAFLSWFFGQKGNQYSQVKYLIYLLVSKLDPLFLSGSWNKTPDMKDFSDSVITDSYEIKSANSERECSINKLSIIRYSDRIDIYIRCGITLSDNPQNNKILEIIVENKIDSSEGRVKSEKLPNSTPEEQKYAGLHQTERYYYACSKEHGNRKKEDVDYQLFVYLTPDEINGSNGNDIKGSAAPKCKNFISISYQDLVDYVFEPYLKQQGVDSNVRSLLVAYIENLGNPYINDNKKYLAMGREERELLVKFFEQNKELFILTLEAMQNQALEDGDDEAAKEYKETEDSLKNAGSSSRHYYSINGVGRYKMYEVIEEYIKTQLNAGVLFANIPAYQIACNFISDKYGVVSKPQKAHKFEHNGNTYYVTKELMDKGRNRDNFTQFRKLVDCTSFHIEQLKN